MIVVKFSDIFNIFILFEIFEYQIRVNALLRYGAENIRLSRPHSHQRRIHQIQHSSPVLKYGLLILSHT